ncbi:DegV family protein [Bacillaceae bacterium S4-13-58]
MTVKIVADSACDLPNELYQEYNIKMVPLVVTLDGQEYEDSVTISPKTVYDAMRSGKAPKTSQVSQQAFREVFMEYVQKKIPLVYFAFSSELSGTYQSAKIVQQEIKEEYPDAELHVVDTKGASLGYGLVIVRAAQLAIEGKSVEEIITTGLYHATHMEHIFTVDDLEYLYRGGRVSKTAAFVGGLLKIKPLLDVEDGKLIPIEKIRGAKKVLKRMVEVMEERGKDFENQTIGISHGDDLENAEKLKELIQEKWNCKDFIIHTVGATIGAHSGPGTIALFFLNDDYK